MSTLKPRPEFLDTVGGQPALEGVSLTFLWLEGAEGGFYLGTDTDSWQRGLYWTQKEGEYGFYCFAPEAMLAKAEDPTIIRVAAALTRWRDRGFPEDLQHLLFLWNNPAAHRVLLEPAVKTYRVELLETQAAKRRGHMDVRASSPEEALRMVQQDGGDDELSNWGEWFDDQTEIVTVSAKEAG